MLLLLLQPSLLPILLLLLQLSLSPKLLLLPQLSLLLMLLLLPLPRLLPRPESGVGGGFEVTREEEEEEEEDLSAGDLGGRSFEGFIAFFNEDVFGDDDG